MHRAFWFNTDAGAYWSVINDDAWAKTVSARAVWVAAPSTRLTSTAPTHRPPPYRQR